MSIITIERKVLARNDELARENRELLARHGVFAINVVSSPGAGKTAMLERTLGCLDGSLKVAVVEGDIQTDLDARRVECYRVPVVQIVTQGGCHLEAKLVQDALAEIELAGLELLVIENVGNLVCPANYDLGEALKVVVVSVTEGDDKPLKYPGMFLNASVLLINKIDLLPYVDSELSTLRQNALQVNPSLQVFEMSCRSGEGVPEWCEWLRQRSRPEQ